MSKEADAAEVVAASDASKTEDVLAPGTPMGGALAATDPTLPDGSHYDVWRYEGTAGERVQVTMRSDELDSHLLLYAEPPEGLELIAEDDDGAGGLDAEIARTLPRDGAYAILANSFGSGEVGSYRIRLDAVTEEVERISARSWDSIYPGGGTRRTVTLLS